MPISRAGKVSTVKPCPPKGLSRAAHFQVGPNQDFEVEWMTGHRNTYTYFAIVHSENERYLVEHSERTFQRYISEAPAGAAQPAPENVHGAYAGTPNKGTYGGYAGKLVEGDASYIKRPNVFKRTYVKGPATQYKYQDWVRKDNVFVAYESARFPWLEGVYRFKITWSYPKEFDTARLRIPARAGKAGRYIVHYVWRGYYDCFDVDVLGPGKVASDKWGRNPGKKEWVRIDHCQFKNYMAFRPVRAKCQFMFKTSTVAECMKVCLSKPSEHKAHGFSCNAVTVVPAANPPATAPMFRDATLCDKYLPGGSAPSNSKYKTCRRNQMNIPWTDALLTKPEQVSNPIRWGHCRRDKFPMIDNWARDGKTPYMCYGLWAEQPNDVGEAWTTTQDPEDPVFYSSCYVYGHNSRLFSGETCGDDCLPKALAVQTEWRYGDRCIPCNKMDQNANLAAGNHPNWALGENCTKCETVAPVTPASLFPSDRGAVEARGDGSSSSSSSTSTSSSSGTSGTGGDWYDAGNGTAIWLSDASYDNATWANATNPLYNMSEYGEFGWASGPSCGEFGSCTDPDPGR